MNTRTIILFSAVPWQGLVGRPHHLAMQFASRGDRVLFVEPSITWLSPLKKLSLLRNIHFGKISHRAENLVTLTPPPILPGGYRWRLFNKFNQESLAYSVASALAQLGWPKGIIITHLPGTADYPSPEPIIYECVDDHAAFSEYSSLWKKELVHKLESDLLTRACGVVATAQVLLERCQRQRPDTLLVGNGAAVEHFAPAAVGKTGATGTQGLVAGFYGGIGPWVDLDLVVQAAELAPQWQFYMVGPLEGSVRLPRLPHNVLFPGFIAFEKLPAILGDFDVALIPFRKNELTVSVNPIKLYEYFAAGKPVLVTDIPELVRWGELVYPVSTAQQLVEALQKTQAESAELPERRKRVAQENSWSAKVDALYALIEGLGL